MRTAHLTASPSSAVIPTRPRRVGPLRDARLIPSLAAALVGLGWFAGGTRHAEADLVANHAVATARGIAGTGNSVSQRVLGATSAATVGENRYVETDGSRTFTGQATARASLDASHLLGVSSAASGNVPPQPFPSTVSGNGRAHAFWVDVAFVDGPNRPEYLDLTFGLDGRLGADPNVFGQNISLVSVGWTDRAVDFSTEFLNVDQISLLFGAGSRTVSYNSIVASAQAPLTYQNGRVGGEVTFRANYNATLGGYAFTVELYSESSAAFGAASGDFTSTLALTRVSAPGGAAAPVRFDSGLRFTAVPEPSSIALVGLGAGPLLAAGWRRRPRARRRSQIVPTRRSVGHALPG